MRILFAFILLSSLLCFPLYTNYANDRLEPDYMFYEARLNHIDKPSKLLSGTVKIKMDMDRTYLLIRVNDLSVSSSITSFTINGPALEGENGPVVFTLPKTFMKYTTPIIADQAEDLAHGLYYISIKTVNNPEGELRGIIEKSAEAHAEPKKPWLEISKLPADISRYIEFLSRRIRNVKSMPMNLKSDPSIHPLSGEIMQQLAINKPTLLSKYIFYKQIPDYKWIVYRPRQFDSGLIFDKTQSVVTNPGIYKYWDFLNTPNDKNAQSLETPQWLTLHLNRPAVIGIIWRGGTAIPGWLTSWTLSSAVGVNNISYPVYTKKITTTKVQLGSSRDPYHVLIAESNSQPSEPPTVPPGLVVPNPNKACPDWVHDQYLTHGPDEKLYATWHPQIDPVFWCYFGHEHGSDPHEFDTTITLPFGYAGAQMGMHEKHVGFKVYVWDDKYGYRFLVLQHQGTSSNQAVCGRHHELDFFVKKIDSDTILAKRYFVGDYGVSRSLVTGKPFVNSKCPDQKSIESSGARFLPIASERKTNEPWVVSAADVIGFKFSDFVVSAHDSVRLCKDYACDQMEITENTGSLREISYVEGLGPWSGLGYSGTFYTDPSGSKLLTADDPQAVEQYTAPGTSIKSDLPQSIHLNNSTLCYDVEGFGSPFTCGITITSAPTMRENSIRVPN